MKTIFKFFFKNFVRCKNFGKKYASEYLDARLREILLFKSFEKNQNERISKEINWYTC